MQIGGRRGGGRNINTGGDEISHCVTWYILMSLFEEEEDHEDMRVVKNMSVQLLWCHNMTLSGSLGEGKYSASSVGAKQSGLWVAQTANEWRKCLLV